ncbi:uncharacterized protein FIBRA_02323 [Fibroporia radiculosa]|uniref:Vacuolar protein sorting-associated protein 41 n=1 Tax=Fibroporia radiculosa TaxID=599839 RepID=J4G1L3_9APHY|nr:uncharacterized protein FIBRA_02323 [Fibroporia radiculosa]CCM00293.1 predicted protein [Fibroporia radiculosa]
MSSPKSNGLDEKQSDTLATGSEGAVSDVGDDDPNISSPESNSSSIDADARQDAEKVPALQGIRPDGKEASEDGDSEGSFDEDEDDSEDEDDDEPALKYERLGGITQSLLQKGSISVLAHANQRLVRTFALFFSFHVVIPLQALGTHDGMLHVLDLSGTHVKSFEAHSAYVTDISMDLSAEWIATTSIDGETSVIYVDSFVRVASIATSRISDEFPRQVVIHSVSTSESQTFRAKRSLRSVALEPNFAKSGTRSVVYGGMEGSLVLQEKGWLGYKETVLHSNEGPVWKVRWRGRLIAWANDLGVKIYDTVSQTRITFIDRPADSPRADLFGCTLHWQDDSTLLVAWADQIKVARIRARPRTVTTSSSANLPPYLVEVTAVFQLDCMVAGIVPHPLTSSPPTLIPSSASVTSTPSSHQTTEAMAPSTMQTAPPPPLTAFLLLAYSPPDTSLLTGNEATSNRDEQARKAAERPELRIVSRGGEELASDALGISNYERWGCNDYHLVEVEAGAVTGGADNRYYIVVSPKDVVVVKPRDWRDHVAWLVERKRYEEALDEIERQAGMGIAGGPGEEAVDAVDIGQRYIEHLVSEGEFIKAARLCPKVCGQDVKRWEDWIFFFAQKLQLQAIIPYVPTDAPTLGHLVYEMIMAYYLANDRQMLLQTIKSWPKGIYDISAVIVAVQAELDRSPSSSSARTTSSETVLLMESLAELYTNNRQPGKALPFFLRLRRPNVFDLIRENNLFTAVQDQVLLLVEFDHELMEIRKKGGEDVDFDHNSTAIILLVDHIHSIPIGRVVQQLQSRPYYLYMYLDALFHKDPQLTSDFADVQVKLYAEYASDHLIDFLRASNYYSLEEAYNICNDRDMVPEMVFLLGRMGNNKKALTLIIERMGDVNRAIDFAKGQHDDDLWEDLLRYSETRPSFIRGLLENVGAEIDPIRLIRRIKNGLEIPGLKGALIKILHDFNLQTSLLEGCQMILDGDCAELARHLHRNQTTGFFISYIMSRMQSSLTTVPARLYVALYVPTRSSFTLCS